MRCHTLLFAAIAALSFVSCGADAEEAKAEPPEWAATPNGTVVETFDSLKTADISTLEQCFSPEAWQVLRGFVPDTASADVQARLGEILKTIEIDRITFEGSDVAIAHVVIETADGPESEQLRLKKTSTGWVID